MTGYLTVPEEYREYQFHWIMWYTGERTVGKCEFIGDMCFWEALGSDEVSALIYDTDSAYLAPCIPPCFPNE